MSVNISVCVPVTHSGPQHEVVSVVVKEIGSKWRVNWDN